MKKQIIFLGAPGSGKGTQAQLLTKDLGHIHLSTGDLLRKEINEKSDLGLKVSSILEAGQLVDDGTVIELLKKNCDSDQNSYIFDGFPRTLEQAKKLDEDILLPGAYRVFYFKIDKESLLSRLTARRVCSKCNAIYNLKTHPPKNENQCDDCGHKGLTHRKDDHEEVIKGRLEVFENTVNELVGYYKGNNALTELDASDDPTVLLAEIKAALKG